MSRNATILALIVMLTAVAWLGCSDDPVAPEPGPPRVGWIVQSHGTGFEVGNAVAVDPSGNVFVAGKFRNESRMGTATFTNNGVNDVILAKLNDKGGFLWARQAGGTATDDAADVATDALGNAVITGQFSGTATFGTIDLVSAGSQDIYVAKYDPDGTVLWAVRGGGTSFESGISVAVDVSGNVYATGFFRDTIDFGTGPLTSAGNSDIFIVKYNSAGVVQWARRAGNTSSDIGNGIATDAAGNVYVTGSFSGTIDFGNGPITSPGNRDVFIVKFNTTGTPLWAIRAGGTDFAGANDIAVRVSSVAITGGFVGTATFGGTDLTDAGSGDIFVATYTTAGAFVWARRDGGTGSESGRAVSYDASGNVVIAGAYSGDMSFGTITVDHLGRDDVFGAKYNATGAVLWAWGGGNTGSDDRGFGIATDDEDNVYTTGQFAGDGQFGVFGLESGGSFDIFVYKTDPAGR